MDIQILVQSYLIQAGTMIGLIGLIGVSFMAVVFALVQKIA